MTPKKKLIEVALPLPEINDASAYDKMPGIGPHPKGIHQWWARLPLPTARAVLFASVVTDPSDDPVWATKSVDEQNAERERLFTLIRKLMGKKLHERPAVYAEARTEMRKHIGDKLPAVLDPFAGGGSIPLEALRLGFAVYAGDLNPVAVLLNKCNLELAPTWADHPPVNPSSRAKIGGADGWRGTLGLACDVRYYGARIRELAIEKIGHLYPHVRLVQKNNGSYRHATSDEISGRSAKVENLNVIAWIWARTVASPNPAARGAHVPLLSTYWLSTKAGQLAWLEPVVNTSVNTYSFSVHTGIPKDKTAIRSGTKLGRGANFRCLLTGQPISDDYVKIEGQAGRMGRQMVAIVADVGRGRIYLPPKNDHAIEPLDPTWKPDGEVPQRLTGGTCYGYGLTAWSDLFTSRQLTTMVTLSDCIRAMRTEIEADACQIGATAAATYARTVATFLALALDRCADFNNSLCRWSSSNQKVMNLFGRQAIPMVWDFAEANLLGESVGSWTTCSEYVADCVEVIGSVCGKDGQGLQIDAASSWDGICNLLISTDPPYYNNIGYATLSDFFYVWLRRTIGDLYPELFGTMLVPKMQELTASPERFEGNRHQARDHFESGFKKAFATLREKMDPRFPLTVYYAFKQSDEDSEEDGGELNAEGAPAIDLTTGWETLLEALISTGFQITSTWPVRASQKWRMVAMGTNAMASYIVLACRPRPESASQTDRRSFVAQLKRELPAALRHLQQGNIAPVDFAQASIGPGMAVYSKYTRILESNGTPMTVRAALSLINQTLTEVLTEREEVFDNDTRWALAWFEQHAFRESDFGDAEVLSKAKVTSVEGLREAGVLASKGGKVRLLRRDELPATWDPASEKRLNVWGTCAHLIRVLQTGGETGAATLMSRIPPSTTAATRDLAYRLFNICERKGWAQEALAYNSLVIAWPEVARLAQSGAGRTEQRNLL